MRHIRYAILNFGYVESSRLGSLVLYCETGTFTSEQDAIKSLANDLLTMYKVDIGFPTTGIHSCCREHLDCKYCPDCGTQIKRIEINRYDFEDWLIGLMLRDVDSVASLDQNTLIGTEWTLGYSSAANVIGEPVKTILVIEQAEKVIRRAAGIKD